MNRDKRIITTSIIGISTNILLAAFKAFIGVISNSIAIVLDAVNNLSDALSSVITIIGTKLSTKEPDKAHPYGYGRVEYLSTILIGVIVLYAGITSLFESIKKVINPELPEYRTVSLIIIIVAVIVKFALGNYYKKVGKEVHSDALMNSGQDALFDSILSASTVVSAFIFIFTNVSLEAYLGVIISIFIIRAGIEMLKETISKFLGERVDSNLAKEIKKTIMSFGGINGVYDLSINDFGPMKMIGSAHIEVPDSYTANQIDTLTRDIQHLVLDKHKVILTAIGIYSHNTTNQYQKMVEDNIRSFVMAQPHVLEMHGFYMNERDQRMRFDVVVDFDADWPTLYKKIQAYIKNAYPDYVIQITRDIDTSD